MDLTFALRRDVVMEPIRGQNRRTPPPFIALACQKKIRILERRWVHALTAAMTRLHRLQIW